MSATSPPRLTSPVSSAALTARVKTKPSYFEEGYAGLRLPLANAGAAGLRPAQVAAAHALSGHFFARHDPAIVVMPTGSGKTCVMILAAFLLRARRVLVLTPSRMVRDQLVDQFAGLHLLKRVGALAVDVALPRVARVEGQIRTAADWKKLAKKDVVVSTVQSASPFLRGVAQPPPDLFDLIMVDEAHHAPAPSWRTLLECFPAARVALFTATPFRRDERTVRGRLVFEYSLERAREDGVFGRIQYEPVVPSAGVDPDVALAKAAEARLKSDRKAGLRHLLMVRSAQRARAEQLAALYHAKTSLRLATVFGAHTQKHVRSVVKRMVEGDLDGVICVDMLGEGFDLPSLKVAALHSPHRSLAVTLQFIGRFARTTSTDAGSATFLAIPSEIETEAEHLYRVGAEWNEIVEEASRRRIDAERDAREIFESFAPADFFEEGPSAADEALDIADLAPRFHVKIFSVPSGVDLKKELDLPVAGDPVLVRYSGEHNAVVCVTKHVETRRWSADDRISNVTYDLFVLFFDEDKKLLFICSTQRETAVYDAIVEAVAVGRPRLLSPQELNRVLRGLTDPQFFSVGMRKRAGREESYRMVTGRAADRVIQKSDGRFYDRGHCYGKGTDGTSETTIGFSSSSKVWSNQGGRLPEFFAWCKRLGAKIVDRTDVATGSGLDHLPLPSQVATFPKHIIAADWNETFFSLSDVSMRLRSGSRHHDFSIHDFELRVDSRADDEITFSVIGAGREVPASYRLDRGPRFFRVTAVDALTVVIDGAERSIEDALNEWPPSFFTATMARLQADQLSGAPPAERFDASLIEEVDWTSERVDPLREKPSSPSPSHERSLFEWLEARLQRTSADVIFNDDDAGEAADLIALTKVPGAGTHVDLYHCKAAERRPVPGKRVKDLYEVVGQATKSVKMTLHGVLRRHLVARASGTKGMSRVVRGSLADVDRLLADNIALSFRVVIVQPGIGRDMSSDQDTILAASHSYLFGANVTGLTVIGSKSS